MKQNRGALTTDNSPSTVVLFTKLTTKGPCAGLSNEILSILTAQGAATLRDVKV